MDLSHFSEHDTLSLHRLSIASIKRHLYTIAQGRNDNSTTVQYIMYTSYLCHRIMLCMLNML